MRIPTAASALVPMAALIAVAGCGSTAPTGTAGGSSSQFALARCMRSHGLPNFPDPTVGPGGAGFSISSIPGSSTLTVDGTTFSGPVFKSAVRACKLFGGGSSPPPISAQQRRRLLAFAQCMRSHGVPDFPDPTFPSGGGVFRGKIPSDHNAPAFAQAVTTCRRP
jgi:hypothetical protein